LLGLPKGDRSTQLDHQLDLPLIALVRRSSQLWLPNSVISKVYEFSIYMQALVRLHSNLYRAVHPLSTRLKKMTLQLERLLQITKALRAHIAPELFISIQ
jgi:hypothetical protein